MNTQQEVQELRKQVATRLARLGQLTEHRNLLLHLAVDDPGPSVVRALRYNRQLADATRRAARLARAQLSKLEAARAAARDGGSGLC